jgi:hypothetical protein
MGIPLDAVSHMMGHSSTKTTEKYYCRKTNDSAIIEAQQIYAKMSKPLLLRASGNSHQNDYGRHGGVCLFQVSRPDS